MAADLSETATLSAPQAAVEDVSPLEQDLLDEYERLADNMKKVNAVPRGGPETQSTTSQQARAIPRNLFEWRLTSPAVCWTVGRDGWRSHLRDP